MHNGPVLLLLAAWHHLHVAGCEPSARMSLMLLAAGLSAAGLLLGGNRVHFVSSPGVLRAASRGLSRVARCGDVLDLARSHALGGCV